MKKDQTSFPHGIDSVPLVASPHPPSQFPSMKMAANIMHNWHLLRLFDDQILGGRVVSTPAVS